MMKIEDKEILIDTVERGTPHLWLDKKAATRDALDELAYYKKRLAWLQSRVSENE